MRTKILTGALVALLSLSQTACIKKMLLNGQIEGTREGAKAADTIGDYELARAASSAGVLQFEGMHRLAPDNEDALYLLMKGWMGYGYAFASDDYEVATLAGDEPVAEYHKKRAKMALDRSISYGIELLEKKGEGFMAAKKNADTMKKYLAENFKDKGDAENLFWLGAAWLARVNVMKEEYIAELFVGVALLERSRELDPTILWYNSTNLLGAYHARAAVAELDEAKKMFEFVLDKTGRKNLGVQLNYATKYACAKADKDLYEKLLNEVLSAEDPEPTLRLQNAIAKRRARRALTRGAMEDCGFDAKP